MVVNFMCVKYVLYNIAKNEIRNVCIVYWIVINQIWAVSYR